MRLNILLNVWRYCLNIGIKNMAFGSSGMPFKKLPITPRAIMTHHSGLPADLLKGSYAYNPEPFEIVVKEIEGSFLSCPTNSVFYESTPAMSLLGVAIERVAGRPYASHVEEAVFSPLGMNHSSFDQEPDRSSLASKAYEKGEETVEIPLRDIPALGLVKIENESSNLKVELMNMNFSLIPRSDDLFHLQFKLFGLIPIVPKEMEELGFAI